MHLRRSAVPAGRTLARTGVLAASLVLAAHGMAAATAPQDPVRPAVPPDLARPERPAIRSGPEPLDLTAPIPYFIAPGQAEDGTRPGDLELARWALEAWARALGPSVRLVSAREPDAVIRLYWAGPQGGQYGEMRGIVVNGRRGAAVYIRPDTSSLGPDIAALTKADPLLRDVVVHLTCVHELGHAFGLTHTRDFRDIMYSFVFGGDLEEYFGRYRRRLRTRADIARTSAMSDGDLARLQALYPQP
ncbi:MAG: matrixin family metalloprotease [Vicinamibacterales bacterium]